MSNIDIVFFDLCILFLVFYLCLGLYAISISIIIKVKNEPLIANQNKINAFFVTVLSIVGYFLFFQPSSISVQIIYFLFVIDLYILLTIIPTEFRIICQSNSPKSKIIQILMRINIPFENINESFLLINRDNRIFLEKTKFSTYRIILEKGKDKNILKKVEWEYRNNSKQDKVSIHKHSVNSIFLIGVIFLVFSISLLVVIL